MNNWDGIRYFRPSEFRCKCGQCPGSTEAGVALMMQRDFLQALDDLRHRLGSGIRVTSGYRCPPHNAAVSPGTGRTGPHTTAQAADLDLNRGRAFAIMTWLEEFGFTGVGWDQKGDGRFVHLDNLNQAQANPRPTVWSY